MNMSQVKPFYKKKSIMHRKGARKKHVESMFLTNKQKRHLFYFKNKRLFSQNERCLSKFVPSRFQCIIKVLESGYINVSSLKAVARLYK